MTNKREIKDEKIRKAVMKLIKNNKKQKKLIGKIQKKSIKERKDDINDKNFVEEIKDKKNKYDTYSDVQVGEQVVTEVENKPIKKMKKKLKKQRKTLKKLEEIILESEQPVEVEKEKIENKKDNDVKNYIHKIRDIFLKALPKIMNKVLPLVVDFCLKNCCIWKKKSLVT